LLHEHDEEGRLGGTSVAGDEEHLAPQTLAFAEFILNLERSVDVVQITSGLQLRGSQLAQGVECLVVAVSDHVPSGRLGAEVHLDADEEGAEAVRKGWPCVGPWALTGWQSKPTLVSS
jgi:hypothetical protein